MSEEITYITKLNHKGKKEKNMRKRSRGEGGCKWEDRETNATLCIEQRRIEIQITWNEYKEKAVKE